MRIGVLGLGRIGAMHARNASAVADEVLVYDAVPGRAASVLAAARPGGGDAAVRVCDAVEPLLRAADAVVIATPTATHAELTLAAVRAGVPVLCEKPLAMELDRMRALIKELRPYDVPVMVGFQRRYDPAYAELRGRVAAGETGRVQVVRSASHDRLPPDPAYVPTSGGVWRDLLIHDFDAVSWIVGERVTEVYATGSVLVDGVYAACGDADTATATLRFEGGALGVVTGARRNGQGYDCRLEVFGADATLATGVDGWTPVVSMEPGEPGPDGTHDGFMDRFAGAYRAEMVHFAGLIRGKADNLTPPVAGLHALEIALACERSVSQRRPVSVPLRGDQHI
jgi:myo-inositol 2-dehydrogenase/D-chiro-inositol 1-dehydrogenase